MEGQHRPQDSFTATLRVHRVGPRVLVCTLPDEMNNLGGILPEKNLIKNKKTKQKQFLLSEKKIFQQFAVIVVVDF
jgi:hypothetical protein